MNFESVKREISRDLSKRKKRRKDDRMGQKEVMALLETVKRPMTAGEVAKELKICNSSAQTLLRRLLRWNVVERKSNPRTSFSAPGFAYVLAKKDEGLTTK